MLVSNIILLVSDQRRLATDSVFTVRSVRWNAGTVQDPHAIDLDAAVDNQAESEDL